jgi:hypothetical protein
MKSIVLAALSFTALIGVPAGSAQTLTNPLVATIPFDFHVGRSVLPAGRYEVKQGPTQVIVLKKSNGSASAVLMAPGRSRPDSQRESGFLRFERYGDQYLLTEIFEPGLTSGLAIRAPKAWKEMKESMAAGEAPRTVEIAASIGSAR